MNSKTIILLLTICAITIVMLPQDAYAHHDFIWDNGEYRDREQSDQTVLEFIEDRFPNMMGVNILHCPGVSSGDTIQMNTFDNLNVCHFIHFPDDWTRNNQFQEHVYPDTYTGVRTIPELLVLPEYLEFMLMIQSLPARFSSGEIINIEFGINNKHTSDLNVEFVVEMYGPGYDINPIVFSSTNLMRVGPSSVSVSITLPSIPPGEDDQLYEIIIYATDVGGLFEDVVLYEPESFLIYNPLIEVEKKKSGGGSDSQWKTKPTFGMSHTIADQKIVQCGFSWNGVCYDITDNWHTEMELIKVKSGDSNEVKLKGFFQHPPLFMEFGLTPEIGHLHKAESLVTVFFDGMNIPTIDRVEIVQERDIIDDSLTVSLDQVDCGYIEQSCYEITIHNLKFNEIPEFEVAGVHAVDTKRRDHTTYFNDGIKVEPSTQQLLTQYILSQQITLPIPDEVCIGKQVLQRYDCNFADVIQQQRYLAEQTHDNIIGYK